MTSNRYEPPGTAVADIDDVPIATSVPPGLTALERAPAAFIGLLFFVLVGRAILVVVTPGGVGTYAVACLQMLVFAFICWRAISGSNGAAFLLATLLFLGAVVTIAQIVLAAGLGLGVMAIFGAWAFILTLTGMYIAFSPAVRRFYSEISVA